MRQTARTRASTVMRRVRRFAVSCAAIAALCFAHPALADHVVGAGGFTGLGTGKLDLACTDLIVPSVNRLSGVTSVPSISDITSEMSLIASATLRRGSVIEQPHDFPFRISLPGGQILSGTDPRHDRAFSVAADEKEHFAS